MPIPNLTNEDVRRLKTLLKREKRANSQPREAPRERLGDNAPTPIHWVRVKNLSTETVPAHGMMMPIRGSWIDGRPGFEIDKPDWAVGNQNAGKRYEPPFFLVNWERDIPAGKKGWGAIEGPVPALIDGQGTFGAGSGPIDDAAGVYGMAGWKFQFSRTIPGQQPETILYFQVGEAASQFGSLGQNHSALLTPQRGKWALWYVSKTDPQPTPRHVSRSAFVAAGPAWRRFGVGPGKQYAYVMRRQASSESFAMMQLVGSQTFAVGTGVQGANNYTSVNTGRTEESGSFAVGATTGTALVNRIYVSPSGLYLVALSAIVSLPNGASAQLYAKTVAGQELLRLSLGTNSTGATLTYPIAGNVVSLLDDGDQVQILADITGSTVSTTATTLVAHRLGA